MAEKYTGGHEPTVFGTEQFTGVFSEGEIHCLLRLRRGFCALAAVNS